MGKKLSFGKVLMLLGLLLLLGAGGLYGYNQWIDYQAGQESETAVITLVEEIQSQQVEIVEVPNPKEEQEPAEKPEMLKVAELDGAYYMGVLTIPALEKILPIQSDWSEAKLKKTPCRYSGSLEEGELVIAGHNYKKHFSGLATLKQGDSIVFTDLEGNQIFYEVREIYTVAATDIEGMINSGYDLSLFTCNYGGKARVTVRCNRVDAAEIEQKS
jgi:sortase A